MSTITPQLMNCIIVCMANFRHKKKPTNLMMGFAAMVGLEPTAHYTMVIALPTELHNLVYALREYFISQLVSCCAHQMVIRSIQSASNLIITLLKSISHSTGQLTVNQAVNISVFKLGIYQVVLTLIIISHRLRRKP